VRGTFRVSSPGVEHQGSQLTGSVLIGAGEAAAGLNREDEVRSKSPE
jgi:hypothetical protein